MKPSLFNNIRKKIENIYNLIPDIVINIAAREAKSLFFIQIGACDGVIADPIRKYILGHKWEGILVEPVKYLFERLKKNYNGQTSLIFENMAVAETDGTKRINYYRPNQEDLPDWYEGSASLLMNFYARHADDIPDIDKRLISEEVECITFENLLKKYNVKKIDLLQIDTEGYEYRIIKSIDFRQIKPRMIYFEHICLTVWEYKKCVQLLLNKEYKLVYLPGDTFAFLKQPKIIYIKIALNLFLYIIKKIFHKVKQSL